MFFLLAVHLLLCCRAVTITNDTKLSSDTRVTERERFIGWLPHQIFIWMIKPFIHHPLQTLHRLCSPPLDTLFFWCTFCAVAPKTALIVRLHIFYWSQFLLMPVEGFICTEGFLLYTMSVGSMVLNNSFFSTSTISAPFCLPSWQCKTTLISTTSSLRSSQCHLTAISIPSHEAYVPWSTKHSVLNCWNPQWFSFSGAVLLCPWYCTTSLTKDSLLLGSH